MTRFVQTVAVALSLLWSMGVVSAATYSFTTLDFPGATQTEAYGVNDAGHVVGVYQIGSGNPRGFVFDGATYTDVPVAVCPHKARQNYLYSSAELSRPGEQRLLIPTL
jgi:probable HAF family extracellular repeat protein